MSPSGTDYALMKVKQLTIERQILRWSACAKKRRDGEDDHTSFTCYCDRKGMVSKIIFCSCSFVTSNNSNGRHAA